MFVLHICGKPAKWHFFYIYFQKVFVTSWIFDRTVWGHRRAQHCKEDTPLRLLSLSLAENVLFWKWTRDTENFHLAQEILKYGNIHLAQEILKYWNIHLAQEILKYRNIHLAQDELNYRNIHLAQELLHLHLQLLLLVAGDKMQLKIVINLWEKLPGFSKHERRPLGQGSLWDWSENFRYLFCDSIDGKFRWRFKTDARVCKRNDCPLLLSTLQNHDTVV